MRRSRLALGLLFITVLFSSGCTAPYLAKRQVDRIVGPAAFEEIDIVNASGNVTLNAQDTEGVTVRERIYAWGPDQQTAEARAAGITLDIHQVGRRLIVRPELPDDLAMYSLDLDLNVPASLRRVQIRVDDGEIAVRGGSAELDLAVDDGRITAQPARWEGDSRLSVGRGSLALGGRFDGFGSVRATIDDGQVEVRPHGFSDAQITADTDRGQVTYTATSPGQLKVSDRSSTHAVFTIGLGFAHIDVHTHEGNIHVAPAG